MGMDLGFSQRSLLSSPNNIYPPPPPPPYPPTNNDALNLGNKVSPSVLLIIIILAIIVFISGLLHLLGRFLLSRHRLRVTRDSDQDELSVTALQGQLQQLFELHDCGVDQSFIDTTLPVFTYKSIIGVKMKTHPFDCAVCLCEFEGEDKLRLLPQCSHAFHMDCIDTWLLSHSTCPLCRASLLLLDQYCSSSPILLLLESAGNTSTNSEDSRPVTHLDDVNSARQRANSNSNTLLGSDPVVFPDKSTGEIHGIEEEQEDNEKEKLVVNVTIKLGKFKNVDGGGEGSSTSGGVGDSHSIDARRCFSMGSFEYVVDENSSLQVPIIKKGMIFPLKKHKKSTHNNNTIGLCHRAAMSECGGGCDSTRDFNFNSLLLTSIQEVHNPIGRSKRESFSVSKIWLRGKKEKPNASSNSSSSSFQFQHTKNDDGRDRGRTISEIMGIGRSGELGFDQGNQSWRSTDSQAKSQSFTKTLFWLMSRQNNNNKVVHDSSAIASNV